MSHRPTVKMFLTLVMVSLAGGLVADTPADYANLPGRKAMATVPGFSDSIYGIGHSQQTDNAAAEQALQQCQQRLAEHAAVAEAPGVGCEVINLNHERVTSGADIRGRVPEDPHPLYLWRFTSATATVYLAGSIHILKSTLHPMAPQIEKAFEQSDYLVLEVDAERYPLQEMQRKMLEVALLPDGQTLKKLLAEPLLNSLNEHLSSSGIPTQAVAQFKPMMVMNQLVLLRLSALGYKPEFGLEQYFRSKLASKQVLELETLDAQLDVLFNQPLDMQIQLLADTLDIMDEIEPLLVEMLGAWLAGDDDELLRTFEQQSGASELAKAFNRRVLDDRNVTMAQTIKQYLDATGTYFVLIGAAHFVGEAGIVNLLRQQGITGARVMSDKPI